MTTAAGLDRGLLVGAHHVIAWAEQLSVEEPGIQVEHHGRPGSTRAARLVHRWKLDLVPAGRRHRHVLPERAAGLGSDTPPPVGWIEVVPAATRVDQDQPAATPDPARPGPLARPGHCQRALPRGARLYRRAPQRRDDPAAVPAAIQRLGEHLGFAIYLASRDGYEDNILPSGLPAGSPKKASTASAASTSTTPPAGPYPRRINGADHLGIRMSTARGHHSGDALILASG